MESDPATSPSEGPSRLDSTWTWLVGWPVTAVLGGLCVYMIAAWIPHYLTWPWWIDLDDEAVFAHAWDLGIVPYRDIIIYQFPGQIYLFWILGKLFGWGASWAIYAVDAGFLVAFGIGLLAWSRRRTGRFLPGIIGYLFLLRYYLSLNYRLVAQRDFQSGVMITLAILVIETIPKRIGLVLSALLTAGAAVYRPHSIFLVPALIAAIDETRRESGESWRVSIRPVLEWIILTGVFTVLAFAPLIFGGLIPTMLGNASRFGTVHSKSLFQIARIFYQQFKDTRILAIPIGILILALRSQHRCWLRTVATWLIAWLGMIIRRPAHPEAHAYLEHPLMIVMAVLTALLVALLLAEFRSRVSLHFLLFLSLLLVTAMVLPEFPRYSSIAVSRAAIKAFTREGLPPSVEPSGYQHRYRWDDYRALLVYLRDQTGQDDRILNLLPGHVALPGPIGRLSIYPFEGGIRWIGEVDPEAESRVIAILEATPSSVVAWEPNNVVNHEEVPAFDSLKQAILRLYEPAARFGQLEVWRRKGGTTAREVPSK